MNIKFKYDENNDIDCLMSKGPGSDNQPGLQTRTYAELLKFTSDVKNKEKVREFVRWYISEHNLDLPQKAIHFQEKWDGISATFERRAESIFGVSIEDAISAYLTITGRFPYNLERKFFFVSVQRGDVNNIIMHELWHFYTWYKFGKEQIEKLGAQKYNDVKESLTVILNLECADLMNGETDMGYSPHQKLRQFITKKWFETKDITKTWNAACMF